jgi:hypothetical protein
MFTIILKLLAVAVWILIFLEDIRTNSIFQNKWYLKFLIERREKPQWLDQMTSA